MEKLSNERIFFEELILEREVSEEKKAKMGCWNPSWADDDADC